MKKLILLLSVLLVACNYSPPIDFTENPFVHKIEYRDEYTCKYYILQYNGNATSEPYFIDKIGKYNIGDQIKSTK